MVKMLEIFGIFLVALMILSFVGLFRPTIDAGTSMFFWICAAITLIILLYRKMTRTKSIDEQNEK